nr:hypothetical protein [Tanacetum cinerariifolium]
GDDSSSDEWRDYSMAGDDYEGPSVFDDDHYEEESMPVCDIDIEDVIKEEEGFVGKRGFGREEDNIEDVIVSLPDYRNSFESTIVGRLFLVFGDYSMAGDDYEGPPVFDDDHYEEESMPVYDIDIEDVIEEE